MKYKILMKVSGEVEADTQEEARQIFFNDFLENYSLNSDEFISIEEVEEV